MGDDEGSIRPKPNKLRPDVLEKFERMAGGKNATFEKPTYSPKMAGDKYTISEKPTYTPTMAGGKYATPEKPTYTPKMAGDKYAIFENPTYTPTMAGDKYATSENPTYKLKMAGYEYKTFENPTYTPTMAGSKYAPFEKPKHTPKMAGDNYTISENQTYTSCASGEKATSEKPTYLLRVAGGRSATPEKPPRVTGGRPATPKKPSRQDNAIFRSPMVLVSTVDGKINCEESTLEKLREIDKPLNIVSIVGTLRTGKSFLLNKLARHSSADANSWFETGHTPYPVTKGIWILCRPHPTQKDQVLVLLDTEGIDDPDKVNIEDDKNLFLLATLLSSTMVYNTGGNFDRNAIDKFKFLSRITTSIKINGSEEDDSILDFFFPNFVLTLRDVTLGDEASDDTFLEDRLKLKGPNRRANTSKEDLKEFNLPRMLIRRYFKRRRCFRFEQPVKKEHLKELMRIPETDLEKDFQEKLNAFREFVLSCQPKVLKSGSALNGRMFCTLLLRYVWSIKRKEPPCLTTAMRSMAAAENEHVVNKATDVYNAEMNKRIGSHTPDDTGLVNYHKDSMQAALKVLKAGLIIDDEQIYEEQALACFESHFKKFKTKVEKELTEKCWQKINRLDALKIQAKIKNRQYCTRTGYADYLKNLDDVTQQFKRQAGYMGSVAITVLQQYLDRKSEEEKVVYKMVIESGDVQEGGELKRRKIKCATINREEDEMILKQEKYAEDAVRADIKSTQVKGLQNILRQYQDILKSKIKEKDKVKQELTRSNSYYLQLLKETDHWQNIYEKKMSQTGDRNRANAREESTDKESVSLASQNSFDEKYNTSSPDLNRGRAKITVLPDRTDPEGISDDPVNCDQVVGKRKKAKCDIM